MALATMIKNLNAARAEYDRQLKEAGAQAKDAVGAFLGEHIPAGFAVQWTQYTPYFNDGEACTFSVHEPALVKVSADEDPEDMPRYVEDSDTVHVMLSSYSIERYGWEGKRETTRKNYRGEDYVYTVEGDGTIEGLTLEQVKAVEAAWRELPEDLLKSAFGDHVRCRVYSDGRAIIVDHDHD